MSRTAFLRLEWLLSLALTALAASWAGARGLPLLPALVPTPAWLALGVASGAALWATIPFLLRSSAMRRVWNELLLPFSRGLRTGDIAVLALLSGISEEIFFRGVLLPELGLVLSSVCFGALHALCALYVAWAAVIGAGFGALALATGSLVPPMAAHATYNFGALLLLRRAALQQRPSAPPPRGLAAERAAAAIASPPGIG